MILKKINSLVEDIYALFDPKTPHKVSEENLEYFADNIKELLRVRLGSRQNDGTVLRFSALGKPDRQLWYDSQGYDKEELSAKTYFKFLYGDIIEQMVLFLCKEAGHTVEREQEEIEVNGVLGHIDAIIDGVVVDVKSASPYSYQKFKNGTIFEDDAFGYIPQLSGYANVLTPDEAPAFLAFDKVSGDICVTPISTTIVKDNKPEERIEHLKQVIASPTPPPRCYPDEADGKSGNRKLGVRCSYCAHKQRCWPGLRTFIYSNGPRFLTNVVREPDVYEATTNGGV